MCITRRPCPDGFVLGSLKPHHTPLVLEHWSHFNGWPKERPYFEAITSNFVSRALYSVDDLDSPVTWLWLWKYGGIVFDRKCSKQESWHFCYLGDDQSCSSTRVYTVVCSALIGHYNEKDDCQTWRV